MRKISYQPPNHNLARGLRLLVLGLLLTATGLGCQGDADTKREQAKTTTANDCPITVNTAPWQTFKSMARRMANGEQVTEAELEAYGTLPAVAAWRRSLTPNIPMPSNLANWLRAPWLEELGLPTRQKLSSNRFAMGRNYKYSYQKVAAIDSMLAGYKSGQQTCQLSDLINRWLSPANIPQPLILNCLPTMAEIRIFENQVFVDSGVLAAGGVDQTNRSIAALLYRNFEVIPGTNPLGSAGEEAVAGCLRLMTNEGIAGWIEQTTTVHFDRQHPVLHKVQVVPTDFYAKAQQTFERFGEALPEMFADPQVMAARGNRFARDMAGGNSFTQTGIAMAELIVGRLGETRLHQVRGSVPEFWAAYQEAALLNDTPLPTLGARGVPLYKSLAPLPDALYEPMMALLKRRF